VGAGVEWEVGGNNVRKGNPVLEELGAGGGAGTDKEVGSGFGLVILEATGASVSVCGCARGFTLGGVALLACGVGRDRGYRIRVGFSVGVAEVIEQVDVVLEVVETVGVVVIVVTLADGKCSTICRTCIPCVGKDAPEARLEVEVDVGAGWIAVGTGFDV